MCNFSNSTWNCVLHVIMQAQTVDHRHSFSQQVGTMLSYTVIGPCLGLVALCCEEVLELMAQNYPRKYQEYMEMVQEREFQEALRKKLAETRRVASMVSLWQVQRVLLRVSVLYMLVGNITIYHLM